MDKAAIMQVIEAWSHPDDWNVPSIYVNTVESLLDALEAGIAPSKIAEHAKHTHRQSRGICRVIDVAMSESYDRRAREANRKVQVQRALGVGRDI